MTNEMILHQINLILQVLSTLELDPEIKKLVEWQLKEIRKFL